MKTASFTPCTFSSRLSQLHLRRRIFTKSWPATASLTEQRFRKIGAPSRLYHRRNLEQCIVQLKSRRDLSLNAFQTLSFVHFFQDHNWLQSCLPKPPHMDEETCWSRIQGGSKKLLRVLKQSFRFGTQKIRRKRRENIPEMENETARDTASFANAHA